MYTDDKEFMYERKGIFVDRDLYGAVKAFDEYSRSVSFYKLQSKQKNSKRFADTLSKYFLNVKLTDISALFVLNLLTRTHITDYESRNIMRFLIFLLEDEYIKDGILSRLILFKGKNGDKGNKVGRIDIISKVTTKKIIKILTCKNFQDFIETGTLLTRTSYDMRIGTQLFLMELPEDLSVNSEIYGFLSGYFEDIKLNTAISVFARINRAHAFIFTVRIFFQNIDTKGITREYLYNGLKVHKEIIISQKGKVIVSELYKVVLGMISNGLIKDDKLCHLAKFNLNKRVSFESLLNMLGKSTIDRYVQIPRPSDDRLSPLYHLDIQSGEVRKAFIEFALTYSSRSGILARICEEFNMSLGDYSIKSIKDLNFNTYKSQLIYFNKYAEDENRSVKRKNTYTAPITAFYLYILQNYNEKVFEKLGIDSNILQRPQIGQEILNGYKPIPYNPHEEVPDANKWLLCYRGLETDSTTELSSITSTRLIDFTRIEGETYRNFSKHYLWYYNSGIFAKVGIWYCMITFCNYISDLKSGKVRYLGVTPTKDETITMNEIVAFKYHIMDAKKNSSTAGRYLSAARIFLNYISDHNFMDIEKGVFWHLRNSSSPNKSTANAMIDEDLNKVSALMKKKAKESVFNNLCFAILYLAMHTPFRSSHITTWKIDAIKATVKEGQFRTYARTKTTHGQEVPIPITLRIKRVIDKAIKITEPYRQECKNKKVKNFVFIVGSLQKGTYGNLSRCRFNKYFKKCCEEVGVDAGYTLANLRDTRMSKAEVEVAKKGYSDAEQRALVHHKNPDSINSYSDIDIRECLEAVYQIYIGNIDIKGKVIKTIPKDIAVEEKTVSEGCGYCGAETCDNYSYLDCVMCNYFRTSPEQIPFFKEQIKICDKKITEATINHDKEDLQTIKRLMVGYLEQLLIIRGENVNEQYNY